MGHCINLVGRKFSRLKVIEKTDKRTKGGCVVYRCICNCGKEAFVRSSNLINGSSNSCGCYRAERAMAAIVKHGCSSKGGGTKEYTTWESMKARCYNTNTWNYKSYGGRGIKVYRSWLHSFENFLDYLKKNNMYPRPEGHSIDRIDNNGNYEPGNIQWRTSKQQANNRRKRAKSIAVTN